MKLQAAAPGLRGAGILARGRLSRTPSPSGWGVLFYWVGLVQDALPALAGAGAHPRALWTA